MKPTLKRIMISEIVGINDENGNVSIETSTAKFHVIHSFRTAISKYAKAVDGGAKTVRFTVIPNLF